MFTISGAFVGVLLGEKILPWVIMNAYGMLYTGMKEYLTPLNWEEGGLAILASALCTGVATVVACYKELAARPGTADAPGGSKKRKEDSAGTDSIFMETSELYNKINDPESDPI